MTPVVQRYMFKAIFSVNFWGTFSRNTPKDNILQIESENSKENLENPVWVDETLGRGGLSDCFETLIFYF